VTGRDALKERSTKPVKIAESDIDVSIKYHFRTSCIVLSCAVTCSHYCALWDKILLAETFSAWFLKSNVIELYDFIFRSS